jgi:outer membrane protein assembly factor BamB/tetratricopeptide (TPR) repeat protein
VTIKGTLETFNLLDLLQMLSFNQKVGTLVLETARGTRTIYVETGAIGFVHGDPDATRMLARVLRRTSAVDDARLERGLSIAANGNSFLGDALVSLGALEAEPLAAAWIETVEEAFFDLLQTGIGRFEFVEGKRMAPSGVEGEAILPLRAVDGLLLDLTRKIDEWGVLREEIPEDEEVYESVEGAPEVPLDEHVPAFVPGRVLPLIDGRRSVTALTADSDCDRFHVVKLLAILVRGGAVRRADTDQLVARAEDLLAHGEAAASVPLFRRALDREDGTPALRLRLSSALEALGDPQGAAAELDTFVAEVVQSRPGDAFDALVRALRLRGGDATGAARLCDLWLDRRVELADRQEAALDALRRLVATSSALGRHAEAADRLGRFIEVGAAPSEDLLVLADLHAAADDPRAAAEALVQRADVLLGSERDVAAVPLLRRALAYDSSRSDARRRLAEIEGASRRRRKRRRLGAFLSLFGLTVASAGAVYLVRDGRASRSVREVVERTSRAASEAESELSAAQAAWNAKLRAVDAATAEDRSLVEAAAALKTAGAGISARLRDAVEASRNEVQGVTGGRGREAASDLERFEGVRKSLEARVEASLRAADDLAERAVADGEKAYAAGRFRVARVALVRAINLSVADAARVARARQRLDRVGEYEKSLAVAREPFDKAVGARDYETAWRLGAELLATFLDSDLTRELLLPVPVVTTPPGAKVTIGDAELADPTPCIVRYSPLGEVGIRLRAPGRVTWQGKLPTFAELGKDPSVPRLAVDLAPGARWTVPVEASAAGPFLVEDSLVVASDAGRRLLAVRRADGRAVEARGIEAPADRLRAAGATPYGAWTLVGNRTIAFAPSADVRWQYATVGRLERGPAAADGAVVVVDEEGTVHALEATTGKVRWKTSLAAQPVQPPYASSMGFLVATAAGDAIALSPRDGAATVLVARGDHAVRALPAPGGGVVVLGGGDAGSKRVMPDGTAVPLPGGDLNADVSPWVGAAGVAWAGADGEVRILQKGATEPLRVPGAGKPAVSPVVDERTVYTVDAEGVVRGASLDAPTATLWSGKASAPVTAPPLPVGDLLVLRTPAALEALER